LIENCNANQIRTNSIIASKIVNIQIILSQSHFLRLRNYRRLQRPLANQRINIDRKRKTLLSLLIQTSSSGDRPIIMTQKQINEYIKKIWTDPSHRGGFAGPEQVYQIAKKMEIQDRSRYDRENLIQYRSIFSAKTSQT